MKTCVLDGLSDAAAIYRRLAGTFGFPTYFGANPDALWDSLGDYSGEPVTVTWRDAATTAGQLGPEREAILAVLRRAAAAGLLSLDTA